MRPDMSTPLAMSSGQEHHYTEDDENKLIELISACDVSEMYMTN